MEAAPDADSGIRRQLVIREQLEAQAIAAGLLGSASPRPLARRVSAWLWEPAQTLRTLSEALAHLGLAVLAVAMAVRLLR